MRTHLWSRWLQSSIDHTQMISENYKIVSVQQSCLKKELCIRIALHFVPSQLLKSAFLRWCHAAGWLTEASCLTIFLTLIEHWEWRVDLTYLKAQECMQVRVQTDLKYKNVRKRLVRKERRELEARAKQMEEDEAYSEDIERQSFADMAGSSRQNTPSENSDTQSETETHELGVSPQLKAVLLEAEKLADRYGEHWIHVFHGEISVVLLIFVWKAAWPHEKFQHLDTAKVTRSMQHLRRIYTDIYNIMTHRCEYSAVRVCQDISQPELGLCHKLITSIHLGLQACHKTRCHIFLMSWIIAISTTQIIKWMVDTGNVKLFIAQSHLKNYFHTNAVLIRGRFVS